jgi:uncharacterized protein YecT (DUF1311 family)
MLFFRLPWKNLRASYVLGIAVVLLVATFILPSNVLGQGSAGAQASGSLPQAAGSQPQTAQPEAPQASQPKYDAAIFQKPVPNDQLAFLNQFAGAPTKDILRDKQFHKLMHNAIPDCMFHYGRDMPPSDAFDMVFKDSTEPVLIRDGRYVMVSGRSGPYLGGRGFVWIDMKEGVILAGFFFRPTNGEPTPSFTVFSKQIREKTIRMSQLPLAFVDDLIQWSTAYGVPQLTTRYFITGLNKRILLEHDEDFCTNADGTIVRDDACEQRNADAADLDMNTAYYLEQVNYATNATAWMITGEDQVAWLQVRDGTCRSGPDLLGCRIRMAHERTHVIIHRAPVVHSPHR